MNTRRPEQLKEAILAEKPSDQQEKAIFASESEFFLRASPGSGKTWTSCRRFLWLVEKSEHQAGGVALLSFTNAAIKEFQKATVATGRGKALADPNFVGTFDSFVERFIITPFGHLIADKKKRPKLFVGPRPGDWGNYMLKVEVYDKDGVKRPIPAWEITPTVQDGKLACKGSLGKGKFSVTASDGLRAMKALLEIGFYTHNQRNFWACYLLKKTPRLAEILARRFPEIIVDEAQDTGVWLIHVLRQLRKAGAKVTLVGDPDQCIFEFSLASASSLRELKDEWKLNEKPLDKSFRCNNAIAKAARSISGNMNFQGCGEPQNEHEKPYIFGDSSNGFEQAVSFFRKKLQDAGIAEKKCAILCRGHDQVAEIHGSVRYLDLQGNTKEMAEASFLRDKKSDFNSAFERTVKVLRSLVDVPEVWSVLDEKPDSKEALKIRLSIWKFVRSQDGLPPISLNATDWVNKLKEQIVKLLNRIGVKNPPQLGKRFTKKGMNENQKELPLFEEQALFPTIRIETIHKVKGESIDGVLVIGSKKYFDGVVKDVIAGNDTEDRRLGYVAMTRAKHLLVVAPPKDHLDKYESFWRDRGFCYE